MLESKTPIATLFQNKTIVMSGGSRGVGLAVALCAARDVANVVLIAKTATPDPRLTRHPARAATSARRLTLQPPKARPLEHAWISPFTSVAGPPQHAAA